VNHLEAAVKINAFDLGALRAGLSSWDGATPEQIERAIALVQTTTKRLIEVLNAVEDPDENSVLIAINYIELKTKWIALNTKINYSVFKTGGCETEDALHASSISALIGLLETLITATDIETITDFLSQPLHRAA
jgi:hypothetical protein